MEKNKRKIRKFKKKLNKKMEITKSDKKRRKKLNKMTKERKKNHDFEVNITKKKINQFLLENKFT